MLLINIAATGVLRANAKLLYFKDRPAKKASSGLAVPSVSMEKVFETRQGEIRSVELNLLLDKQVYIARMANKDKGVLLMDAATGAILSPLDEAFAIRIAKTVAGEDAVVLSTELIPSFKARRSSEPRPVYRVAFDDARRTKIAVDRDSGEVLLVMDRGRTFGVWVAKLHELDFPGLGRWALSIVGAGFIVLSVTGMELFRRRART